MKVELIEFMGSDLTTANSARVSFDKHKEKFDDKDVSLITYLSSHGHTSPFRHCFATYRITAPIFVARQLVKHQVGMSWNEVSRRYVDSEPEFYAPDKWRMKAINKKQGSSDEDVFVNVASLGWGDDRGDHVNLGLDTEGLREWYTLCAQYYEHLIDQGVAPEMARMVLPQSMMTSWYWSGSLQAWAHVCNLRCKPDAQVECKTIADQLDKICNDLWPVSWKALRN